MRNCVSVYSASYCSVLYCTVQYSKQLYTKKPLQSCPTQGGWYACKSYLRNCSFMLSHWICQRLINFYVLEYNRNRVYCDSVTLYLLKKSFHNTLEDRQTQFVCLNIYTPSAEPKTMCQCRVQFSDSSLKFIVSSKPKPSLVVDFEVLSLNYSMLPTFVNNRNSANIFVSTQVGPLWDRRIPCH